MEKDRLKSMLAGMGIASLVAGMASVPISAHGSSGWGGKEGAGGTPPKQEAGKSGWGGKAGAGSADKTAKSKKTVKKVKKTVEKPAEKPAQKPGGSGWGGATGAGGSK